MITHKAGYIKGIAYCGQSIRLKTIVLRWTNVTCPACKVARTVKPRTVLRGNLLTGQIYADPPYVCTKCGHKTVKTACPWHGREFIRTRDKSEDEVTQ